MKLTTEVIRELAVHLESAELDARDVVKITDAHPDMDWETLTPSRTNTAAQRGSRHQDRGI